MMELIVLGHVPGTSIQITFEWVAGFSAALIATILIRFMVLRAVGYLKNMRTSKQLTT